MEEHVSVGGFWDGGIDSIKRLVTHFGLDRDLNGGRATLGEGKFEYAVDLPGIGKENIDVAVTGTTLRITGINAAKGSSIWPGSCHQWLRRWQPAHPMWMVSCGSLSRPRLRQP
jgi:hypothetical protein